MCRVLEPRKENKQSLQNFLEMSISHCDNYSLLSTFYCTDVFIASSIRCTNKIKSKINFMNWISYHNSRSKKTEKKKIQVWMCILRNKKGGKAPNNKQHLSIFPFFPYHIASLAVCCVYTSNTHRFGKIYTEISMTFFLFLYESMLPAHLLHNSFFFLSVLC